MAKRPPAAPARRSLTPALFVALLLVTACATVWKAPDLGHLYDRAAQSHGPQRNPIVVIPGLTGTTLVDGATGRTVWGIFGAGSARPNRADDVRLIALPMRRGAPLRELTDGVEPASVVDRVEVRLLGVPIQVKAYVQILAALGVGGYRDESLGLAGAVDYGSDHYTCFQFPYDWRRDNVENARRLGEFIADKRAEVRRRTIERSGTDPGRMKFDVAAHSMGGVLLRYYLRYGDAELPADGALPAPTWAGARDVERAVLIGPPNHGTLDALLQLVDGRDFGPLVPTYPAALLGTFPSGYQLLPRGRHGAVVESGADGTPVPVDDLFDPELWQRYGWGLADPDQAGVLRSLLPGVADPVERRAIALDHQAKLLHRAARFSAALDRPATPPDGLRLMLVAGDAVPTERSVAVDPDTGRITVVARAPGDGTVLRSSALADERLAGDWRPNLDSPVAWDEVMFLFDNHLDLTRNPIFTDNVLYWLLEDPR